LTTQVEKADIKGGGPWKRMVRKSMGGRGERLDITNSEIFQILDKNHIVDERRRTALSIQPIKKGFVRNCRKEEACTEYK